MQEKINKLQQEYANLCATLGERAYHISLLQDEINDGQVRLSVLRKEVEELQRAGAKAKDKAPESGSVMAGSSSQSDIQAQPEASAQSTNQAQEVSNAQQSAA